MRALFALSALIVAACAAPVQEQTATTNGEVSVGLLTTFEGCKVYRLNDAGRYVYIARCGAASGVAYPQTEACGKGCSRHVYREAAIVEEPA